MQGYLFYDPATQQTYTVQHNNDFSGDVIITHRGVEVTVPFHLMQEVVGRWLQLQQVLDIESMSGLEFMEDQAP